MAPALVPRPLSLMLTVCAAVLMSGAGAEPAPVESLAGTARQLRQPDTETASQRSAAEQAGLQPEMRRCEKKVPVVRVDVLVAVPARAGQVQGVEASQENPGG
ncbi:MAG: hypothetical protein QOF89_3840 [Acidobacteriota bacterium]|nr:hypothetical protein [Acidobacteriota bacterium]